MSASPTVYSLLIYPRPKKWARPKFLARQLYAVLVGAFPSLYIRADKVGREKFMQGFEKYLGTTLSQSLFRPFELTFVPAGDDVLIQMADFLAGTIHKVVDPDIPAEVRARLSAIIGRGVQIIDWPGRWQPVDDPAAATGKYDEVIRRLSLERAEEFIRCQDGAASEAAMLQIRCVRFLRSYLLYVDPMGWNTASLIIRNIQSDRPIKRRWFNDQVVGPIRDAGCMLVSAKGGFKLASCEADVRLYLQQTVSTAVPMVARARKLAEAIRTRTGGDLDLVGEPAFSSLQVKPER